MNRAVRNLSHPSGVFPTEVEQGGSLPSPFSSQTVDIYFYGLFSATFFAFFYFFFGGFASLQSAVQ